MKGPRKWTYYYLYVILDIFSRQVVGWMVADCESASLAKKLIRESCLKQRIDRDQLILHADRGSSMKSKVVALLLSDLGVTKSHSRPYVSDDNPFSEAQFKTLKYRPDFPERFGSIQYYAKWKERVDDAQKEISNAKDAETDDKCEKLRAVLKTLYEHLAGFNYRWAEGSALIRDLLVVNATAIPVFLTLGLVPVILALLASSTGPCSA